jgi:hypothetical protein
MYKGSAECVDEKIILKYVRNLRLTMLLREYYKEQELERSKQVAKHTTELQTYKVTTWSEISGSHGSEYEDGCLLGCCAV